MDSPFDSLGTLANALAAALTAVGSFFLGRYQARTKAVSAQQVGEHKEREQLFNHYNELLAATREVNTTLRDEVNTVRSQMSEIQSINQKALLEAAREREKCRIENERLRSELKHLKDDVKELRNALTNKDQG